MKSKKFSAFLCAAMMLVSLLTPAMAAENKEEIVDLGDGFYAVVTLEEGPMTRAGGTKSGSVSATVYNGCYADRYFRYFGQYRKGNGCRNLRHRPERLEL